MPSRTSTPDARITVFVQAHYPEIWRAMAPLVVARMGAPFRLVITTSHPADAILVPQGRHLVGTRVMTVENRGRDILPFLTALAAEPEFDIGLKLHTKKSPQREDGARWLGEVLDSLLPARGGAGPILRAMRADGRIGFVTPGGFALGVRPWVLQNADGMAAVMAAMGHELVDADLEDTFFAAGSMFWFRRPALAALAAPAVLALFPPEEGQLDGTTAHAMERLFPVEAKRQGFVSLAVPALLQSRRSMGGAALAALAREHADIPSTYFPAPYVEALPPAPLPPLPPLKAAYARLPLGLRQAIRRMRGG